MFIRFFVWGIASMAGLVVFGLIYRYFFVSAPLAVVPDALWAMLVGAVGMGLSVVFAGMRVDEHLAVAGTKRMVRLAIQLIKTMLATICIVSTIFAGGLVMKQLMAPMPIEFAYARIAAEVLVVAVLGGIVLFVADLRSR